jgi:hypothetical protein
VSHPSGPTPDDVHSVVRGDVRGDVAGALAEVMAAERLRIVAGLIRVTGDWDLAEDGRV